LCAFGAEITNDQRSINGYAEVADRDTQ
jgi:hypothetical protein